MNEKEKKAQEYADGIAQFGVQNQYCQDDFKAGWDACCKFLYKLPLDEVVEYLCDNDKSDVKIIAKKEFKIGEVFQCGLVKLKVEKAKSDGRSGCLGCLFNGSGHCNFADDFLGECTREEREDRTDVIFVKVEE